MLRGARSSHPCYSRGRGYDSRRAVCEPKSIMVAVSRLAPVGGYSVPPPYVFPRFYHQILSDCPTSYADAVNPYEVGWSVVPSKVFPGTSVADQHAAFTAVPPRHMSKYPTMPRFVVALENATSPK